MLCLIVTAVNCHLGFTAAVELWLCGAECAQERCGGGDLDVHSWVGGTGRRRLEAAECSRRGLEQEGGVGTMLDADNRSR